MPGTWRIWRRWPDHPVLPHGEGRYLRCRGGANGPARGLRRHRSLRRRVARGPQHPQRRGVRADQRAGHAGAAGRRPREAREAVSAHLDRRSRAASIPPGEFFREDSPLAPSSPYAASKAAAEHLVERRPTPSAWTSSSPAPATTTARIQFPEKLIPLAIGNAIEGRPIPVYGDGLQVRDWIHVADNCRALMTVLRERPRRRNLSHRRRQPDHQPRLVAAAAEDHWGGRRACLRALRTAWATTGATRWTAR